MINETITQLIESKLSFIQNIYLQAGLVFIVFLLVAFFIRYFFTKILHRLVKSTDTEIDDKIIETAKGPVFLIVLLNGVFLAGKILGLHDSIGPLYDSIFMTLFSFFIFVTLYKIIIIVIYGVRETFKAKTIKVFDNKLFPFFEKSLKIIFGIIYLFILFNIWSIELTPLLASAGIMGMALAFAAKDSIANVFGGISLFADKTYEIGDYIIVDDKDRGEVVDIGLRSTKIKTRDDVLVVVPNSLMANSKVVNESGINPKLRVRVDLDVDYDADLAKVKKVLVDIAAKADYVEKKPEPRVRFRNFKEFSIHAQLSVWVGKPAKRGRVKSNIIEDIHTRFKKEKIKMPFPYQEIFVRKEK